MQGLRQGNEVKVARRKVSPTLSSSSWLWEWHSWLGISWRDVERGWGDKGRQTRGSMVKYSKDVLSGCHFGSRLRGISSLVATDRCARISIWHIYQSTPGHSCKINILSTPHSSLSISFPLSVSLHHSAWVNDWLTRSSGTPVYPLQEWSVKSPLLFTQALSVMHICWWWYISASNYTLLYTRRTV